MTILENFPGLKIHNMEAMPHGAGAPYLECIRHHANPSELIAKQWRKRIPATAEVIVAFRERA